MMKIQKKGRKKRTNGMLKRKGPKKALPPKGKTEKEKEEKLQSVSQCN